MKNRFHKCLKHIATLLTTAILTITMVLPVAAAETAPTGTLTIKPKYGDKILDAADYNGTFQIYHIASYSLEGAFTIDDEYADLDITFSEDTLQDDETFKTLTQTIAEYVAEHEEDLEPIHEGIKVDDPITLAYGVYLITSDDLATGYLDFESFLAMIPEFGEGMTNTNVVAYPKVSPEPEQPSEPHKPHEPSTPSTPPTTPIEEQGEIVEPDVPVIEEAGAFTGDSSHMMLYGAIAAVAAVVLIAWYVRRKRTN